MDPYILVLIGAGLLILLVAWLPMLLRELPLSLPIICVGIGYLVFALGPGGDQPLPTRHPHVAERITELLVIVALMGSGLKLDRAVGWRSWGATWRLLAIAMPLSILGVAVMGHWVMGLSLAGAILLAGAMAPTDPVLASDVQVGPPGSGEEDEVRFALTSEAGLNDGLAFPVVNLAIVLAFSLGVATSAGRDEDAGAPMDLLLHWVAVDVGWKMLAGVAVGWAVGRVLGLLTFRLPNRARLSRTGDGFLAIAMTFLAYGLTEVAHGYGFIAVFVTAVTFRTVERNHAHHRRLHDFAEQTERLFMMVVLVLFGGALAEGLLAPLTWAGAATGLVLLFVIRPVATWISMRGIGWRPAETWIVGVFGIRGVGSAYYLAYAFNEAGWADAEMAGLWATAGFTILVSVVLHGTTVTPVMRMLDRLSSRSATRRKGRARVTPPPYPPGSEPDTTTGRT